MKERLPKLTIGMPVFNAEKYLEKTLDGLLIQTFDDFEIILSDNGSTDNTQAICERYVELDKRIRYHRSARNRGAAWNFNHTFRLARGKYFKWTAHDDLHKPEFLQRCVAVLDQDPEVVLCFARTIFIDAEDRELREYIYPFDLTDAPRHVRFRYFAVGGHIVHEIFGIIRSEALKKSALIGGYLGSDLVLLGQLALQGKFCQVPEILFLHREHEQRSMINPQGAETVTQWYDASKSGRFVMPYWRRVFENARSVVKIPMPMTDRARCAVEVLRSCRWNQAYLVSELKSVITSLRK